MIDSGIRRGADVLKALALGARFVFVGRPLGFAASVAGEAGVLKAFELLRSEVSRNMGLLGVTSLDQLDSSYLAGNPAQPFAQDFR
jgi:L-lactate dehydrogenase (cytochrome)